MSASDGKLGMREWMPLMGTSFAIRMYHLSEEQAQINHGQSLDVLAQRGGLDPCEALAILERRRIRAHRLDAERDLKALIQLTTRSTGEGMEHRQREEDYNRKCMGEYTEHLLNSLSDQPQTIFQLMNGYGCWESRPVALEIERLVSDGKAKIHHQDGPCFQHQYFVKC